jgi:predicted neutral ceramidase superfamily lipid hydrolase
VRRLKGPRNSSSPFIRKDKDEQLCLGPHIVRGNEGWYLRHRGGQVAQGMIIDGLASIIRLLLASYYAWNLNYPSPYSSIMGFLQQMLVEDVKEFILTKRVLKQIEYFRSWFLYFFICTCWMCMRVCVCVISWILIVIFSHFTYAVYVCVWVCVYALDQICQFSFPLFYESDILDQKDY